MQNSVDSAIHEIKTPQKFHFPFLGPNPRNIVPTKIWTYTIQDVISIHKVHCLDSKVGEYVPPILLLLIYRMVVAASTMPDEFTPPNYTTYTVLPFLTAAAVHMSRLIAFLVLVHNPWFLL